MKLFLIVIAMVNKGMRRVQPASSRATTGLLPSSFHTFSALRLISARDRNWKNHTKATVKRYQFVFGRDAVENFKELDAGGLDHGDHN